MTDIPKLRVEHYPKDSDATWVSSATIIYPEKVTVDQVTGKKTDKASLSLSGANIDLQAGDRIKVYMGTGTAFPQNTDLKIDAIISETSYENMTTGPRWKITGEDRIRTLLSHLEPARFDTTTSSNVIQTLLPLANNAVQTEELKVYWYDNTHSTDYAGRAFNDTTTKTFNYYKDFTEVLEMIKDVSKPEYTGEGFFYYFVEYDPVNDKNFLYWYKRGDAGTTTVAEGEWLSCKFDHQTYDVVNSLILNAGNDANNNGMKTLAIDAASRITHGAKWKYMPMNNLSKEFLDAQRSSSGWTASNSSRYPDAADYPFTSEVPTTLEYDNGTVYNPGSFPVLTDDDDFNDFLRQECKAQAKIEGNNLIKYFISPQYKFGMKFDGTNYGSSFVKGELVTITFNNNVLRSNYEATNNIAVRVEGIQHSFSNAGYEISVTLKEDEPGLAT